MTIGALLAFASINAQNFSVEPPVLVGLPTAESAIFRWNDACYQDGVELPCHCVTTSYKIQRASINDSSIWRQTETSTSCSPAACEVIVGVVPRSYFFRVVMSCGIHIVLSAPSMVVHLAAKTFPKNTPSEITVSEIWDVEVRSNIAILPRVDNAVFFWAIWRDTKVDVIEVFDARATSLKMWIIPVMVEFMQRPQFKVIQSILQPMLEETYGFEVVGIQKSKSGAALSELIAPELTNMVFTVPPTTTPEVEVVPASIVPYIVLAACSPFLLAYLFVSYQYYRRVMVGKELIREDYDVYLFTSGRFCRSWMLFDKLTKKPCRRYIVYWLQYHLLFWCGFFPLGLVHADIHQQVDILTGTSSPRNCIWTFRAGLTWTIWPYDEAQELLNRLETYSARPLNATSSHMEFRRRSSLQMYSSAMDNAQNRLRSASVCSSMCSALRSEESDSVGQMTNDTLSELSKVSVEKGWGRRWTLFGCPATGRRYWYNPDTKVVIWKDNLPQTINVPDYESI